MKKDPKIISKRFLLPLLIFICSSGFSEREFDKQFLEKIKDEGKIVELSDLQAIGDRCFARRKWVEIEGRDL